MNNKLKLIVRELKSYNPEKIFLFGSAARKDEDEYSDLDLVIIKKTKKRFLERLVEAAKTIRSYSGPIDIFVYTPEEFECMKEEKNPFIEQILKEGKVIYERHQGQ